MHICIGIPTITAHSNYYGIKNGSNLNISCILSGLLSSTSDYVKWEHDIRKANYKKTEVLVESPQGPAYVISTLKIVNAKPFYDEGTFMCFAKDSFDNLQDSITVKVHSKSHVT